MEDLLLTIRELCVPILSSLCNDCLGTLLVTVKGKELTTPLPRRAQNAYYHYKQSHRQRRTNRYIVISAAEGMHSGLC